MQEFIELTLHYNLPATPNPIKPHRQHEALAKWSIDGNQYGWTVCCRRHEHLAVQWIYRCCGSIILSPIVDVDFHISVFTIQLYPYLVSVNPHLIIVPHFLLALGWLRAKLPRYSVARSIIAIVNGSLRIYWTRCQENKK